jgi:hypothetical protein
MKKVSLLSSLVAVSFFLTCSLLPSTSYAHRISATSGVFSAVSQGPENDNMPGMKTITNTLTNGDTGFRTMDWQNTDTKAEYLKGYIASQKSLEGKFETALATTEANGSISVSTPAAGVFASFHANVHTTTRAAPAAKPAPGESESRDSELSEIFGATVTSLIEFTSTLTTIDTGLFEYEYKVVTSSVSPITFTWASAGLTGVVSQDEPFTQIFDSVASPLEVVDGTSFLLNGADTFLIATAFAPIPEPSAFLLFGSGLVVLMMFAGRKRA